MISIRATRSRGHSAEELFLDFVQKQDIKMKGAEELFLDFVQKQDIKMKGG